MQPKHLPGIQLEIQDVDNQRTRVDSGDSGEREESIRQRLYWVANAQHSDRRAKQQINGNAHWRDGLGRSGNSGGLADAPGRGQRTDGSAPGQSGHAELSEQGGGVGDSSESGCERPFAELLPRGQAEGRLPTGPGDTGGMGQPNGPEPQPGSESATAAGHGDTIEPAGFWSDAIWHPCRDGKARRIPRAQPGVLGMVDGVPEGLDFGWLESSFPLGSKVQGRVGLLKGYGNAIVPQVAAAFIQAAQEAIEATQT